MKKIVPQAGRRVATEADKHRAREYLKRYSPDETPPMVVEGHSIAVPEDDPRPSGDWIQVWVWIPRDLPSK